MTDHTYPTSLHVAQRLRSFRTTRRMTAEQLARALTKQGYAVSRNTLTNIETGRFRTVPVDLVVVALKVFEVNFSQFMNGPLCNGCGDMPPTPFICKICNRTMSQNGELVAC